MRFHIPSAVTLKVGRASLVVGQHSPTILFVGGVVGVVTTTVLACRATLKVEDVLNEHDEMAAKIKKTEHVDYSERDRKQDMLKLYVITAGKFTKLYGPSIFIGVSSIAALTGSHNILTKRNAGLTAAYATIEKSFKEYRKRVVDEYGEEKDRDFSHGVEKVTVVKPDKSGPKNVKQKRSKGGSPYAKFFDENNKNYVLVPDHNVVFLKHIERYLNDRLKARGHVFLNEVYDELGFDHSTEGAVVGWIWDVRNKNHEGDNHIDFGCWDNDQFSNFFLGVESGVWLDFNVDGVIHYKI